MEKEAAVSAIQGFLLEDTETNHFFVCPFRNKFQIGFISEPIVFPPCFIILCRPFLHFILISLTFAACGMPNGKEAGGTEGDRESSVEEAMAGENEGNTAEEEAAAGENEGNPLFPLLFQFVASLVLYCSFL